jgi:hypothetical protein
MQSAHIIMHTERAHHHAHRARGLGIPGSLGLFQVVVNGVLPTSN